MSKYIFLHLETQDGERRYDHKSVHQLYVPDIKEWAEDYCYDFWGRPGEPNDGWYEFDAGCIMSRVANVQDISESDYNVLKKYL